MKLAFFSSSPLSIPILEKLSGDFSVLLVVTNPDRPVGRKAILTPSVLKTWAIKNGVLCLTPSTLKNESGQNIAEKIREQKIDVAVVIDYGLLIPQEVFLAPAFHTINVHFSLLPKFRGPYPDAFVILKGEEKTGISFVLIDEGYDTGDLLAQKEVVINEVETANELHERLYSITEEILPYIINNWVNYKSNTNIIQQMGKDQSLKLFLPPHKQNHSLATFTKRLEREDGFISWKTLQKILKNEEVKWTELPKLIQDNILKNKILNFKFLILNFYKALSPWPGVWTKIQLKNKKAKSKNAVEETRLKIVKAKIIDDHFLIEKVQLEGKKPISWKEFKETYKI